MSSANWASGSPGELVFQCRLLPCRTVKGPRGQSAELAFHFLLSLELSTMTCSFWLTLYCVAHGFTELDKAVIYGDQFG